MANMTSTTSNGSAPSDVLVIGGGVAGLSAALALGRARRSVTVVDAGRPRNAPAPHSHGYLTRDGASPLDLVGFGRAEVRGYGGEVVEGTVVSVSRQGGASRGSGTSGESRPSRDSGADREGREGPRGGSGGEGPHGDVFRAELADGTFRYGRRLLVTTGLVDELPDVPGLRERWGRDVVHCPYCFGWELLDAPLGVLATGPHAVEQALMWRQWSADLVLFRHTGPAPTGEQRERLAARGIPVVAGEVAGIETADDRLTGIRLRSGEVVARSALVVAPRMAARGTLPAALGVPVTEDPGLGVRVEADASGRTSVPGVWAAGNAADPRAGVVQSAASGMTAAVAINADLTEEDTVLALASARTLRRTA